MTLKFKQKIIAVATPGVSLVNPLTEALALDDTCGIIFLDSNNSVIFSNDLACNYLQISSQSSSITITRRLKELLADTNLLSEANGVERVLFDFSEGEISGKSGETVFTVRRLPGEGKIYYKLSLGKHEFDIVEKNHDLKDVQKKHKLSAELIDAIGNVINELSIKRSYRIKKIQSGAVSILKIIDEDKVDRIVLKIIKDVIHGLKNDTSSCRLEVNNLLELLEQVTGSLDKAISEELSEAIEAVKSSQDNLKEQFQKIMHWNSNVTFQPMKISLSKFINDRIAQFRALYPRILFKLIVEKESMAWFDANNLEAGLKPLLENAARALEENIQFKGTPKKNGKNQDIRQITFTVKQSDKGERLLVIEDNGIGCPECMLPSILQEGNSFSHPAVKRDMSGLGIGVRLAWDYIVTKNTAKDIVFHSDGWGKGMRVTIVFPRRKTNDLSTGVSK